jgi:poly(3-hydroxybutyrate) depolymerase
VYIAGISAGGAMTAIMGATYPELFAGMAIHSGIAYGLVSNASEALIAMRGPKGDSAALGDAVVKAMGERRKAIPLLVFQGEKDPSVVPANASLLASQWRTVNVDAVEVRMVEHLAHAWSGGSREGTYADEKGPDASRAIVDFFLGLEPKKK